MSWARLDDGFHGHPKILAVPLEAVGLHAKALSYAAAHGTDGRLTLAVVTMLAGSEAYARTYADLLCDVRVPDARDVGLWARTFDMSRTLVGYEIHDFLDYNPSSKALKRKRKEEAKRLRAYRDRTRVRTDVRTPCRGTGREGKGSVVSSALESGSGRGSGGNQRATWRTVPATETLTDGRRAMAVAAGLPVDRAAFEWAKFVDHEFQAPKKSVDGTWRNWAREAADRLGGRRGPAPAPAAAPEQPELPDICELHAQRRRQERAVAAARGAVS